MPHLSDTIIFTNLKNLCSKMQHLSGNQRPDLLTSLVKHCTSHAKCISADPLQTSHACHRMSFFATATKPLRFAHFMQSVELNAPAL